MTRLEIALFGGYECTLRGRPIDDFVYDKVRALLAYLSVESERAHRREYLAGLLWPDQPEDAARKSLRQALSKLRQAIDDHTARPPHLSIRHDTIQFNRQSDYSLDISQFTDYITQALHQAVAGHYPSAAATQPPVLAAESVDHLQRAIDLYRGDFLEGFYLRNTPEFENWWLIERARLREQYLEALQALADHQASQGNFSQAIALMRRYLELEPWHEEVQRCLMTWLTLNGQRAAALAQYERLRQILDDELEIEPAQETSDLYQRIRSGELAPTPRLARSENFSQSNPPAFLCMESQPPASPQMTFVARETQMARLSQFLEAALSARGQMAFLSSEAGWGKTSLLANFSRHAQDAHPHLVVASGICSTYKGAGDPYLPFREILRMLCGDVEAKWAAGAISRQDALRLWALLPTSAHALVSQGRNLIDTFVPYLAFLDHAQAHAGMAPELVQQIRALRQIPHNSGVNQERILEEYLEVLMEISRKAPLLLILDDLHWADSASINLLYHLGRRLRDSAVMILGAYRPEDVHLGRDGKAHPLAPVLHEFKGLFGNIWLHLDQGGIEEGRQFVDALLERTPNQLDDHFRELLTRNTRGRPLFIAEMLLEMQERGDLQQDEAGRWVNRAQITWDALPERVEGVIESRVNRLDPHLREALTCASVEGEEFTAQVIGRVLGVDDETMVRRLSMELAREHKLIQARGVLQHGEQRISRYQFSHILFQKYIYSTLDTVERVHLHAAVADALECLYQGQKDEIAGLLAWHYQQAGAFSQAIAYSKQAGETAARVYAMTDAIAHFQQAIRLAEKIGLSGEPLSELYIRLGRYQELDSAFNQALRTYEQLAHLALQQRNPRMELASLMARITILSAPTAVHDPGEARLLGERALFLASELNDPAAEARILWSLSIANFFLYHLQEAIIFGERSLALARQHNLVEQTAQTLNDIGGMVYLYSGRLSQARHALQEASDLWRQLGNMAMLTDSLGGLCITHVYTGNFEQAIAISRQAYQLSVESKNLWGQSYSLWTIGDAYAERGEFSLAIESMQECIRLGKQAGFLVSQSYTPIKLAQIYLELGNWDQAISLAEAAVNFSEAQVPAHAALGRSVLARLQIHSGKLSEASANIQAAKRDPYRDSWLVFFLFVPLAEAELAIAQGMPSNALAILDELIRRLQNYDMRLLLPEALYLSGQALLGSGQEQFAQARFVEALAEAEATGSRRCVWRSMCALSRLEAHADQASTWLHKAGVVLDWILALFSEQHAYLRESFIAQADVKRVMAGRDGSK